MAELEEKGLIEQPHTSAGRIPTDRGYRKYVDHIKERLRTEKRTVEHLAKQYSECIQTIQELISETSMIINKELRHASLIMLPTIGNLYLKKLELIKIRAQNIMGVLVTVPNVVRNYIITLDRDVDNGELEKVANYINDKCEKREMAGIPSYLESLIADEEAGEMIKTAATALEVMRNIVRQNAENEIFFDGVNFFGQEPEFGHPEIVRRLLRIVADKKEIARLMREELPYRGVKIYIGRENHADELMDFSLITSGYDLGGNTVGRIGVIGPTRMDYDNALTVIDCLSGLISSKLEEMNG